MNNISYKKNIYSYEVLAVLQDSSPKIIYKLKNSVIIYLSLYSSKSVWVSFHYGKNILWSDFAKGIFYSILYSVNLRTAVTGPLSQ